MQLELNVRGHVRQRESQTLEFKQSFQPGDLPEYARTLVGMANNQGGTIVFGVKNKPHEPVGLVGDRFDHFDPKDLNQVILDYFSCDVDWAFDSFDQFGKRFGLLSVTEALLKPVICAKHHDKAKLREGAVYFRYRAQTKEIRYAELAAILQAERDKEKALWMKHIQAIATVGPQAVQIVDTVRGELEVAGTKVIVDRALIEKLRVIREGQFVEKGGAPTLRLVGEISGLLDHDHVTYTEAAYPYTQDMILAKLPIKAYDFQALIWKFEVKGNPRYHTIIKTGRKAQVHKYSEQLLTLLRDKLRNNPGIIEESRQAYKGSRRAG